MKERNYEDDLEDWEQEFGCSQCGNDLLQYERTVANGEVWICKKCNNENLLNHKPNPDNY